MNAWPIEEHGATYFPDPLPLAQGPSQGPEELRWGHSDLWQSGLCLFIPTHAKAPAHREVERSSDQETTGESFKKMQLNGK